MQSSRHRPKDNKVSPLSAPGSGGGSAPPVTGMGRPMRRGGISKRTLVIGLLLFMLAAQATFYYGSRGDVSTLPGAKEAEDGPAAPAGLTEGDADNDANLFHELRKLAPYRDKVGRDTNEEEGGEDDPHRDTDEENDLDEEADHKTPEEDDRHGPSLRQEVESETAANADPAEEADDETNSHPGDLQRVSRAEARQSEAEMGVPDDVDGSAAPPQLSVDNDELDRDEGVEDGQSPRLLSGDDDAAELRPSANVNSVSDDQQESGSLSPDVQDAPDVRATASLSMAQTESAALRSAATRQRSRSSVEGSLYRTANEADNALSTPSETGEENAQASANTAGAAGDSASTPNSGTPETTVTRSALRAVPVPVPLSMRAPFIRRATPPPPSTVEPPLLMPGRDSLVRDLGTFTLVTVVWNERSLASFQELMTSVFYTGLVNHTRLLELLVYLPVSSNLDVPTVRTRVAESWDSASAVVHGHSSPDAAAAASSEEQGALSVLKNKVRIVRQPLRGPGRSTQQMGDLSPAPATIIEAMRLVRSEFVIFNPVEDPVYLFPHITSNSTNGTSTHERLRLLQKRVRTILNVALQTMTNNALVQDSEPDAPLVIDQSDFLRKDEVHAFRLQVYPSAASTPQDPALVRAFDKRIAQFLAMLVQDMEHGTHGGDQAASRQAAQSILQAFQDPHDGKAVVDGLPKAVYGANTQYHCQRAPVYGVGIYVPSFFRSPQANAVRARQLAEEAREGEQDANAQAAAPGSVTSLCEALLTSPIRMEDVRAQATFFARHVCAAWAQLTGAQQQRRGTAAAAERQARLGQSPVHPAVRLTGAGSARVDLCASACSFDWLTTLKNEQLFVADAVRRRHSVTMDAETMAALAARSPLHAFARMAFTPNITDALGYADRFFPFAENTTDALFTLRDAMQRVVSTRPAAAAASPATDAKSGEAPDPLQRVQAAKGGAAVEPISVKYVVENQRERRNKMKREGDMEVLCVPSNVCGFTLQPTLYRTDWVVGNVLSRCLRHPSECAHVFGSAIVAAEQMRNDPDGVSRRMMEKMTRYLSDSGRWGAGAYKVCMTSGMSVHDPFGVLGADGLNPGRGEDTSRAEEAD